MRLVYAPAAVRGLHRILSETVEDLRGKPMTVAADPRGQHPWAKRSTGRPG